MSTTEKQTPKGMSIEEAKEHLRRRNLETCVGVSWDTIERLQGGKLKRLKKTNPNTPAP